MKVPVQITSRDVPLDEHTREKIQSKAAKLDKFFRKITACRVVVESPNRHKHKGNAYNVRIDLTVPGEEIVINREEAESLDVAIQKAFGAAKRKLEDHVRLVRGKVKHHEEAPAARVADLFKDKGYGFLETAEGRQIYFHRNSVLNDAFDSLEVGTQVTFVEEMGDKGPQASTVRVP